MQIIPISSLIIPPDRIRRDFNPDALSELRSSILSQGLFHPLLVRADGVTLIAGERRKRVLEGIFESTPQPEVFFDGKPLPGGCAPVVSLSDQDAIGALEAELSENTRRQQLTWQEQAAATKALHDLRREQHFKFTPAQLAEETDRATKMVRADLAIAPYLDDAEIQKAPDRKTALKILERKLTTAHQVSLAERFGRESRAESLQCYHGDMRAVLDSPLLAGRRFECIIADPPYGIDADKFANQSAERHTYADDAAGSNSIYAFIAGLIDTRCAPQAHAYLFCDVRRFEGISTIFASYGWRVWPWPLIWSRGSSVGLLPWPEHGPRRTYDAILYAIKGDRRVTGVFPDVLSIPHDSTTERGAHKPSALYADLINRSCIPGDSVLDPCCGTGPIFPAARSCNVRAVGIEIEDRAYGIAAGRLTDPLASALEAGDE